MTDRINHAAMAASLLDQQSRWPDGRDGVNLEADRVIAEAQAHATLALVEQQRIANLIALASGGSISFEEAIPVLRDEAASALMEFRPISGSQINGPDEFPYTRDDIAKALGLS